MQWKNTLPKGYRISQSASSIDVLPTLSESAQIPVNTLKPLEGKSLVPLLMEHNPSWEPSVVHNRMNGGISIRMAKYRLDNEGRLYNMIQDSVRSKTLVMTLSQLTVSLKGLKNDWLLVVMPKSKETEDFPFTIGHSDFVFTRIPARDREDHGNVERRNWHPNCTFFTNWKNTEDSII